MHTMRIVIRGVLLISIGLVVTAFLSACSPFGSRPAPVAGLWQGEGDAVYTTHVWENGEIILENTWHGRIELTIDVISDANGSINGEWFWRDVTSNATSSEPSSPLSFTGTHSGRMMSIETHETETAPVSTVYNAEFIFEQGQNSLVGGGSYSEDGKSPEARVLFEITLEDITLRKP